jgi:hypothetical protein
MSRKSQSFGFDILLTVTALLLFNQLMILSKADNSQFLLLERGSENERTLYNALLYNNSIVFADDYACNGNNVSYTAFRSAVNGFLDDYVLNREYLLSFGSNIISSENVTEVCLVRASPIVFNVTSSCGTILTLQFSIYTKGELRSC